MNRDEQMVSEFVSGREVPEIAARYGADEAYVDRLIEQTQLAKPSRERGLSNWGNRLALSVVVGWLFWLATFRLNLWIIPLVAVVFYALTTAIVGRRTR